MNDDEDFDLACWDQYQKDLLQQLEELEKGWKELDKAFEDLNKAYYDFVRKM